MIVADLIKPELDPEPISVNIHGVTTVLSVDDARELMLALEEAIEQAEEYEL